MANSHIHLGKDVRYAADRFFDGQIDEVRIWNRALSIAEIAANKDCELVGDECGLVHYYQFNEGVV